MSVIESDLRAAIEGRRVVRLGYNGDSGPERTVHPHALFKAETGNLCLDSYQVDGYTTRGVLPQWRMFTVEKVTSIEVLDERFTVAPGWNPNAKRYRDGLVARV
ncbi:MAG: WYL domain-containing protein [Thermoleophilaceae bacterium]